MSNYLSRLAGCAVLALTSVATAHAQEFLVDNLITNNQAANPAQFQDPAAVNMWGISHSGGSPFWVSNNGTGTTTVYSVNPANDHVTKLNVGGGPVINVPGGVTGQVFNTGAASGAFNKDNFLFVGTDGTISGWHGGSTASDVLQAGSAANSYTGVALATVGNSTYLYAANTKAGTIDVLNGSGGPPALTGTFTDPNLPAGFAPFNIQNLNGKLYVTYVGASGGIVDAYSTTGDFLGRIGAQGTLDGPWGLALAPGSFGKFAGDLLVGNLFDGTINAFQLSSNGDTGSFVGQLDGTNGNPISIDGLWALNVGNNGGSGSSSRVYFSAGPQGGTNGLFGSLAAVPEPGINAMLMAGLFSTGLLAMRRKRA